MRKISLFCLVLWAMLTGITCRTEPVEGNEFVKKYPVIPTPVHLTPHSGKFHLFPDTPLCLLGEKTDRLREVAIYFKDLLSGGDSLSSPAIETGAPRVPCVVFQLVNEDIGLGAEGYELTVRSRKVLVKAMSAAGIFYAIQTLRQLLPKDFESETDSRTEGWLIPGVTIKDLPRFRWRGMMLDVCRHFFPKEFIKDLIEEISMYKINTLHLHLTDDQGWRLEIKKYPRLTEVGAWRSDKEELHWNARAQKTEETEAVYGGYYTQEDMREILEFASSRFITIVPEIEMPAHSVAALAAYPGLSCKGGPFTVLPGGYWPISDIFCAGKENVFNFLGDVLQEVVGLFPGPYIHIGGDEADKTNWIDCPDCQARIEEENLADEVELQSYFIKRIEKFINANNRKMIGWDEILEGGLAPQATVMSWRGKKGGIEAAKAGHDVIMSPTSNCYFDYYQGNPETEPLAIGGFLPLEKVYDFEPLPEELTEAEGKHILGAQANLWTEYIPTPDHAEYMTFPRILALSEVVWSDRRDRNFKNFVQRLGFHFNRLDTIGIKYSRSLYDIDDKVQFKPESKQLEITLRAQSPQGIIRYALDDTPLTESSKALTSPLIIRNSSHIRAGVFQEGRLLGKVFSKDYNIHKAAGCPVNFISPDEDKEENSDPAVLTDCIRGSKSSGEGNWLGWLEKDMEVIMDIGKVQSISSIGAGFLLDITRSIFLPEFVEFSVSEDGTHFRKIGTVENETPLKQPAILIKEFKLMLDGSPVRYIRIKAENMGISPQWHVSAGKKAWIFVDEIIVE